MSEQALMLLRLAGAPTQAWNSARHAYSPGGHHARHLPALDDVTPASRTSSACLARRLAVDAIRSPISAIAPKPTSRIWSPCATWCASTSRATCDPISSHHAVTPRRAGRSCVP